MGRTRCQDQKIGCGGGWLTGRRGMGGIPKAAGGGREVTGLRPVLLDVGQGDSGSFVQFLGVPDGPIFFEQLEEVLQDRLGVSGYARFPPLEAAADRFGKSLLQVQKFLQVYGPFRSL